MFPQHRKTISCAGQGGNCPRRMPTADRRQRNHALAHSLHESRRIAPHVLQRLDHARQRIVDVIVSNRSRPASKWRTSSTAANGDTVARVGSRAIRASSARTSGRRRSGHGNTGLCGSSAETPARRVRSGDTGNRESRRRRPSPAAANPRNARWPPRSASRPRRLPETRA